MNNKSSLLELNPCPFCGGEAVFSEKRPHRRTYVTCVECSARQGETQDAQDAAVYWNRRCAAESAEPWPEPKVTNTDIASPTGVAYLDCLIHRVLDAQQDINFAANEGMNQSLCDASELLNEVEESLRIAATLRHAAPQPAVPATQSMTLTNAIKVIRAESCPFREGPMADGWVQAWATFLDRLGDVDGLNELYANSLPTPQPAVPADVRGALIEQCAKIAEGRALELRAKAKTATAAHKQSYFAQSIEARVIADHIRKFAALASALAGQQKQEN